MAGRRKRRSRKTPAIRAVAKIRENFQGSDTVLDSRRSPGGQPGLSHFYRSTNALAIAGVGAVSCAVSRPNPFRTRRGLRRANRRGVRCTTHTWREKASRARSVYSKGLTVYSNSCQTVSISIGRRRLRFPEVELTFSLVCVHSLRLKNFAAFRRILPRRVSSHPSWRGRFRPTAFPSCR